MNAGFSEALWRVAATITPSVVAAPAFNVDITVPYIGVPVNVIVGAVAGTIAGFAFAPKEESRSTLFKLSFLSVVFACAATALVEGGVKHWLHAEVEVKYLAALATMIALLSRFLIPAITKRVPGWLDRVPFIGSQNKGE